MNADAEKTVYSDPMTRRPVTQWTRHRAKDQHLYFTSFSVTADDRWLTILSERDGHPNLYAVSRPDGAIRRISRNASGLLRSYVYPYGKAQGLSKASPALDPRHNRLYWIQDDAVWRADLDHDDAPVRICPLQPNTWSAFTHVSPDGKKICVPVTDERAFDPAMSTQWEQMRDTVARIRKHGWKSWIYQIDTETGDATCLAEIPFWVTHVQYDPAGSGRILFNMEGGRIVRPRIWCLEPDRTHRPLYDPDAEDVEWDSHENWAPRGGAIVYHGKAGGAPYLAAREWDGTLLYKHVLNPDFDFMHATLTMEGDVLLVDRRDGVIGMADPATGDLRPLCRHDSSSWEQDCHVHPITVPGGGSVIFTSDRDGAVNVYEVSLPSALPESVR